MVSNILRPHTGDHPYAKEPLRVIVLTHGGAEGVVDSILPLSQVRIVGIFVETDIVRHYGVRGLIQRSVRYDGYAATARKFCRRLLRASRRTKAVNGLQQSRDDLRRIAQSNQIPFQEEADHSIGR